MTNENNNWERDEFLGRLLTPMPYEMPITFNEGVGSRLDTRQIAHFDELQQAFALQRARQVELND